MNELLQKMECCICLSFLVDDGTGTQRTTQNEVAALQCGHLFHMPCVMQHLEHNAACPLCRIPATAAEHLVALDLESSAPLTPLNTLGECSPYQTSLQARTRSLRDKYTTIVNRTTALQEREKEMQEQRTFVTSAIANMKRQIALMERSAASASSLEALRIAAKEAKVAVEELELAHAWAIREGAEIEEKIAKMKRKRDRSV
jgi:hypothetical protein